MKVGSESDALQSFEKAYVAAKKTRHQPMVELVILRNWRQSGAGMSDVDVSTRVEAGMVDACKRMGGRSVEDFKEVLERGPYD